MQVLTRVPQHAQSFREEETREEFEAVLATPLGSMSDMLAMSMKSELRHVGP